ncbi:MAG: OsmC family protein [Bacteroidales bacterium]
MKIYFAGGKKVFAEINEHTIKTDQSVNSGGEGEFPEPFTLFLASLGTCAGIYVKNFCDHRNIDSSDISLEQKFQYHPVKKLVDRIKLTIYVPSTFPEKYHQALIQTASLCAVKRHLSDEIKFTVQVEVKE